MLHGDSARAGGRLPGEGLAGTVALVVLFAAGAIVESVHLGSLQNPAVWGHLRIGTWIWANHSVPRTGIFSQSANLPWRDFSWSFDAFAAAVYKIFGMRAMPALAMGFRVIAAFVLFLLAGGRRGLLWSAAALAAVGLYTVSGVGPTATAASVILFAVELLILVEWRRTPGSRAMWLLPALFLIWANMDIGFVYGIVALALFVAALWLERIVGLSEAGDSSGKLARSAAITLVASLIVSGLTPYGYTSYSAFWDMETSAANLNIPGYAAMGFRQTPDYVVLLLGMSAFLAMGFRRSRDIFLMALLSGSAMLAFHSQRENWLLIVASLATIGCMTVGSEQTAAGRTGWNFDRRPIVAEGITLAVTLLAFLLGIPRDPKLLMAKTSEKLPVKACDYIRGANPRRPLFNAYQWGAFLTWYLPEYPVAIDGRRGLYPEEMESDYFKVMKVEVPYQTYAAMKDAQTILLEKSNVVANGLKDVAGFRVAYEDDVAIVLLRDTKE